MSDRIDFFEVRKGDRDNWDNICLCKSEEQAEEIIEALRHVDRCDPAPKNPVFFIEHVEIVARTNLEISDY